MSVLTQSKISFFIDDLLRDTHGKDCLPADTPAEITTGYPKYCFPPKNLSSCCFPEVDLSRDSLSSSPSQSRSTSSPSDSDTESSKDPSDQSDTTPIGKTRPSFSVHQVETLKSIFAHKQYLGKAERKQLAIELNMTDEQVKTWFQNKRTKLKKRMFAEVDEHYAKMLYFRDLVSSMPPEHRREFGFHGIPEYPGHPLPAPERPHYYPAY